MTGFGSGKASVAGLHRHSRKEAQSPTCRPYPNTVEPDLTDRAERRHRELTERGETVSLDAVADDIAARDARDTKRDHAPLRQAPDAVMLDTSGLTIDGQVERVLALVREQSHARPVQTGPAHADNPPS